MSVIKIKNMVCPRCVMAVEQIMNRLSLPFLDVQIGEIKMTDDLKQDELSALEIELNKIGFQFLTERREILVQEIKQALNELVENLQKNQIKTSHFLTERFNLEYSYLSKLFSEVEGESIEKYFIGLRVSKAMELLKYNYSLSEIMYKLNYSSLAHLSMQFKKVTGTSPSEFKKLILEK